MKPDEFVSAFVIALDEEDATYEEGFRRADGYIDQLADGLRGAAERRTYARREEDA